jgi:hypothetical protein
MIITKLDKAKKVIKHYYDEARCGIFNTRNLISDPMETLYEGSDITVDICRPYEYCEVFGLSDEEFSELEKFYNSLAPTNETLDDIIEAKLREIEESIEIRTIATPYTMEEKYNLCTKVKRILDVIME